ncbi:MAG: non-canonical purine NTP pyrophosphatase [Patescibacteria group bacterium]
MQKLLIATHNKGKLKELSAFLADLPVELLSFKDLQITDNFEEKGKTYEENSQAKALFYSKKSGLPAIADDGGIEIDALGKAPGIKSKRWLGYDASDEDLIKHMIKVAKDLPENNRRTFFKAVVSFALPDGKVWSVTGEIEGIIAEKPYLKLLKGYPYRSFFYLPKIKKYYHEDQLTDREQKLYNHRYIAISRLKPIIAKVLCIK